MVAGVCLVGAEGEHGLLDEANDSVGTLLGEGHFLLFLSHCILLYEWGLAGADSVAWHVIECRARYLVHIAQRSASILLRFDANVY